MFILTAPPGKVPLPHALCSKEESAAAGQRRRPQPNHTLGVPRNAGVHPTGLISCDGESHVPPRRERRKKERFPGNSLLLGPPGSPARAVAELPPLGCSQSTGNHTEN